MAIEKESTGIPEMNVHKRTTKVNLWMIAGLIAFFVLMFFLVMSLARRHPGENRPSSSTQEETTGKPGEAPRPRPANSGDSPAASPPKK